MASNGGIVRYATIVADPPWNYRFPPRNPVRGRVEERPIPYPAMSIGEISALPVQELADDDAALFVWTVHRYLPSSFEIIAAWGFDLKQVLIWQKTGNPIPFSGSIAPHDVEFLVFAKRGAPKMRGRLPSSLIPANKRTHSEKPELFLDLIEQIGPPPFLELFARRNRLGWDTWGKEAFEHVGLKS